MNHARMLLAAFLGLAFCGLSVAEDKDLARDIRELAEAMARADKSVERRVEKLRGRRDFALDDLMRLYSLRAKQGLGIGVAGTFKPDGIESMLSRLANRLPTADDLAAAQELERAGYQSAAIMRGIQHMLPDRKLRQAWPKWIEDCEQNSIDFARAARTKNARTIQESAGKLLDSCTRCHTAFRMGPMAPVLR